MKKLITVILITLTGFVRAQQCEEGENAKPSFYMAAGLSMSNTVDTTFSYSSYPSIECGLMGESLSLGVATGRSNLSGFKSDVASNYWYEVKSSLYFPVGKLSGYGVLGIGNYFTTKRVFIEYGLGFSYSFNKFGVFAQASNWDNAWYITPGFSYTF